MTTILGIDPGSRQTGYGIINVHHNQPQFVACGHISTSERLLSVRLGQIFSALDNIVTQHRPVQVAIEQVFIKHNVSAALKLGQARGAAIAAISQHHLALHEYSARHVKKAVTGYGAADKNQVQQMVMRLLKLSQLPQSDAADALAIALCHAFSTFTPLSHLT